MPKILHFEDDPMLAELYGTKFMMAGMTYKSYPSPSNDPVGIAVQEKPDLIVMGIILPDMDGVQATKILKGDPRTKDIPVVGLDNLSQPEDLERFREAGMTDYWLMASHVPAEVVDQVKRLLGLPGADKKPIPPPGQAWHGPSVFELLDRSEPARRSWWRRIFG